ncbi:MAG: MBOAT family protein, partial [Bacteroidia bacterium]
MNLDFLHSASWFEYSEVKPWFFTSHSFFVVLGLVLVVYALLKPFPKPALVFLCAFSLFFYYKSSGLFLILFIAMIACDYVMARLINQFKGKARNVVFYLALVCSLSPLLYFKYTTLFVETCNMYLGTHFVSQQYFLPIGISFYTFQSLSYIIDVYRNTLKANGSFLNYVFYMTFFPHLVAGPIVRAKDFLPQISNATLPNTSQCSWALLRICRGLAKKLILADFLGQWVD